MLHADPTQRPTITELQADEFFTTGYVPLRLPTTCLTVPPRFSMGPSTAMELNQRRPLTAINNKGNEAFGGQITKIMGEYFGCTEE